MGGGTTDLTLIQAASGDDGSMEFERVAVSSTVTGGDNMDLLLAYEANDVSSVNGSLNSRMMSQLVSACRDMKEHAFSPEAKACIPSPCQGKVATDSVRTQLRI